MIKIYLIISKSKLIDPKNISRNMADKGHEGGGDTEVVLNNEENLNYVLDLIEQSYRASKK